MSKAKKENGVTLVSLIITIIVMIIIASIPLNMSYKSIDESKDEKLNSELLIVGQAVINEYEKAVLLGYTINSAIPSNYVGTKIAIEELPEGISWEINEEPIQFYKSYYEILPEELKQIGIEKATDTYIVNYYTGEVYNETVKTSSSGNPLYIKSKNLQINDTNEDLDSFSDWTTE